MSNTRVVTSLVSFFTLAWLSLHHLPCSSQTPPADKYNCSLNNSNPFSYLVQVWDLRKSYNAEGSIRPGTAAWGALITFKAALSSAWYYHRAEKEEEIYPYSYGRYRLIAQNIWDWTPGGRLNPCYQERRVYRIYYHPGSQIKGYRVFLDYSVLLMYKPFEIAPNTSYPTMPVPSSPYVLLLAIRYINTHEQAYCEMPVPISSEPGNRSVINDRIDVTSIKFHGKCIDYVCEQNPPDSSFSDCKQIFQERLSGTMLCMTPGWTDTFDVKEIPDIPNSYAGVPLICNSSVLGISPHIKRRGSFKYPSFPKDFFYVITLLRVWRWLSNMTLNYRKPPQPFYVYNLTKKYYSEPSRAPGPDYGKSSFFGIYDDDPTEPLPPLSGSSAIFEESLLTLKVARITLVLVLIKMYIARYRIPYHRKGFCSLGGISE